MEQLAKHLSDAKQAKGLTNAQISKLSGVQQSTVTRILNGDTQTPSLEVVAAIVKAMDMSLDEFVGIEPRTVEADIERMAMRMSADNEKQLSAMRERYDSELSAVRDTANFLKKQNNRLLLLLALVVGVLVFFLIADIVNKDVGWIQRSVEEVANRSQVDVVFSALEVNI